MDDSIFLKNICPHTDCTGCMACISSCSHSAITISTDELGFQYPLIDTSQCIGCNACYSVCPVLNPVSKVFPSECVAFADNSMKNLMESASGGAASSLAAYVLSHGGIVYGCSGEDMKNVHHIRIDRHEDIYKIRGSKYVQSSTNLILPMVRKDLLNGHHVLFIGTPCQIGGVRKFLRHDYENLITVDIVCHGVASQELLNNNIEDYFKKTNGFIPSSIRFRTKQSFGTSASYIRYCWNYMTDKSNKRYYVDWWDDPYMLAYLEEVSLRECCYICDYAYNVRASDITLSDFWGLPATAGFNNGQGVSSILLNTLNGKRFFYAFETWNRSSKTLRRPVREAISGNGRLMRPSVRPSTADEFRSLYPVLGLRKAAFKVLSRQRLKIKIKELKQKLF